MTWTRRALTVLCGIALAVGCSDPIDTPLLVADGALDPPRDRGPRPDERLPDMQANDAGGLDTGRDGVEGDAGCQGDGGASDAGCGDAGVDGNDVG